MLNAKHFAGTLLSLKFLPVNNSKPCKIRLFSNKPAQQIQCRTC